MLTESEILVRLQASHREAREACADLKLNADPDEIRPRGRRYKQLRDALLHMEGCCRQMNHWRGDTYWIRLAFVYSGLLEPVRIAFIKGQWASFGQLEAGFEGLARRCDELAERPTGKLGTERIISDTGFLSKPPLAIQ